MGSAQTQLSRNVHKPRGCADATVWNKDFRRQDTFLTDENWTQLFFEVGELTATDLTVLGEEHKLCSSLVAGRRHVLCEQKHARLDRFTTFK